MTDLSSIIRKIKALRARAADAASSEAEAAKAAAVADKLLREHNIDLSEVDVRAEGVVKAVWGAGKRARGPESYAVVKIAKAAGVKVWTENGGEVAYLGNPADVEVALYYTDLVANAAESCLRAYRKTDDYAQQLRLWSSRKVSSDYRTGVCQRLGERILAQVKAEPAPTGTGLVVVKDALIRQWLEDEGLRFKTSNRSRRVGAGYNHGRAHADNVGIGQGVGTQRSGRLALGS